MSPLLALLALSIASICLAAPTAHHGWYYPGQPYVSQSHVNVPGVLNFSGQKVFTVPSTAGLRQQQRWNPASSGLFTRILPTTPLCVPCLQQPIGARNPLMPFQSQTSSNDLFGWLFNMTNNPFGFLQPTITRCCATTPTTTSTPRTTTTRRTTTTTTLPNRFLLAKPAPSCVVCSQDGRNINLAINGQQILPAQSVVNIETLLGLIGLTCCSTTTTTIAPTTSRTTTTTPATTTTTPATTTTTPATTTISAATTTTTATPTTAAARLFFNNLVCIQCSQDEISVRNPEPFLLNLLFPNNNQNGPFGIPCCPTTTTTNSPVTPTTTTRPTSTTVATTTTTAAPITTTTASPVTTTAAPVTTTAAPVTTTTASPVTTTAAPVTTTTTAAPVTTTTTEAPVTTTTASPVTTTEAPVTTTTTELPLTTTTTEAPVTTTTTEAPVTTTTEAPVTTTTTEAPVTTTTEAPVTTTADPLIPPLPPVFKQRTFSSDNNNNNDDSLPTDAIPLTGLRLLMNLFPPSYISFVNRR